MQERVLEQLALVDRPRDAPAGVDVGEAGQRLDGEPVLGAARAGRRRRAGRTRTGRRRDRPAVRGRRRTARGRRPRRGRGRRRRDPGRLRRRRGTSGSARGRRWGRRSAARTRGRGRGRPPGPRRPGSRRATVARRCADAGATAGRPVVEAVNGRTEGQARVHGVAEQHARQLRGPLRSDLPAEPALGEPWCGCLGEQYQSETATTVGKSGHRPVSPDLCRAPSRWRREPRRSGACSCRRPRSCSRSSDTCLHL